MNNSDSHREQRIDISPRRKVPKEAALKEAVRRIVEVADPEKIILFGSAARRQMGQGSDLDLLVIKRGEYNRGGLIGEVYRSMHGFGHSVDILLATPEEVERYRNSYCLVFYPALREGRVIYEKDKSTSATDGADAPRVAEEEPPKHEQNFPPDHPRAWLQYARSDLAMARARAPGAYLEHHCFHAQQAAEKAIKAVLISRGLEFSYTHDLAELATTLEQSGQEIPNKVKAAEVLSRFAVLTRYPGFAGEVVYHEYKELVALAEAVVHWAEKLIREIQ